MLKTFTQKMSEPGPGQLRPVHELLDEWDYTYRYHWAVKNAMLHGALPNANQSPATISLPSNFFETLMINGTPLNNGTIPMVICMRHHAFNWLVRYGSAPDWDQVTADT